LITAEGRITDMKKYLLPRNGKFYKANMHTHTTVSDGKLSPEEAKEVFKSLGYSIVAFTDHEVIVPQNHLRDDDFLPITSYEIAISQPWNTFAKCYHLNVYIPDPNRTWSGTFCLRNVKEAWQHRTTEEMRANGVASRRYSKEFVQDMINTANSEGCLVSYNHPVWSLQDHTDYSGLRGIWGVEWHNTECTRIGYYDTMQPIDDLLREGERVYPLATDDCHNPASYGGGWIMVKAKALDYETVFTALRRGDFYSSNGPSIKSLSYEDGKVSVKTSAARQIRIVTGQRITKVANSDEKLITGATFDIQKLIESKEIAPEGRDIWFRVEVTDKAGKCAVTRAYFLSELK
jgi:hypothetical protein